MILSVVMSVYNAATYLEAAIESILEQTYTDFEFIIIDDGSTDNSAKIIKKYHDKRIVFITQDNKGLAASLNIGIATAKGKYIARMDADDISAPTRLEKQIDFLEKHPIVAVLGSNANIIDADQNHLYTSIIHLTDEQIRKQLPNTPFYHSSTVFRKDLFLKSGGYREDIKHYFEDKILWNKMARFGELHNLEEALLNYRLTPTSITNLSPNAMKKMEKISKNILETDVLTKADLTTLQYITKTDQNQQLAAYYLHLAHINLNYQVRKGIAFHYLLKSAGYRLFHINLLKHFILIAVPTKLIIFYRKQRD